MSCLIILCRQALTIQIIIAPISPVFLNYKYHGQVQGHFADGLSDNGLSGNAFPMTIGSDDDWS